MRLILLKNIIVQEQNKESLKNQKKKPKMSSPKKEDEKETENEEEIDFEYHKLTSRFIDQIVVITGGGQSLGRSVALRFAQEGAKVFILDSKRFRETVDLIKEECGKEHVAEGYKCDVTDPKAVKDTIKQIIDQFSYIDVVVNCADFSSDAGKQTHETDLKTFEKTMNVNVTGTFIVCKEVLQYMVEENYGRIINVASIIGKVGSEGEVAYTASSAAIIGMTKTMAKDYANTGVLVNCIAVGPSRTVRFEQLSKTIKNEIKKQVPMNRVADLDEIGGVVAFLASEENSYSTGICFDVSGGLSV